MNWSLYVCGGCLLLTSGLLACMTGRSRRWHRLADKRLLLLRHMIEMAYLYKDRPQQFTHTFCAEIAARKLRNAGIVESYARPTGSEDEADERFLVGLLDAGFTRKEVCAIFNLKSVNCFYVKYHRAKKKLARMEKRSPRTGRQRVPRPDSKS